MSEQPTALRLADKYAEAFHDHQLHASRETRHDMLVFRDALDAELRRLHALNGELLEALVSFTKSDYIKKQHPIRYAAARAVIARAEGKV
jgi:hypothetical protein